jgi:serine/threonine protein kinase
MILSNGDTSFADYFQADLEEDPFEDFDQVDDARGAIDENEAKPLRKTVKTDKLNDSSKDLLRRLLEPDPRHRLKSLLALQRIAFFFNYNFDDVRHLKVSKNRGGTSIV